LLTTSQKLCHFSHPDVFLYFAFRVGKDVFEFKFLQTSVRIEFIKLGRDLY
jgi:hypothetical protein